MLEYEIIVDHGETSNKCTILPLRYRSDFHISQVPKGFSLEADILLHPQGLPLHNFVDSRPTIGRVAAIDCIWRRLEPILQRIHAPQIQVSIPDGFVSAYPRVSKRDYDPSGGLATIEALFIAAAFLGHWDLTLLREYFFAEKFLSMNQSVFCKYGLQQSWQKPVYQPSTSKSSRSRRLGRGRVPL
jgi:pre-rRNA-processing protein TSR3